MMRRGAGPKRGGKSAPKSAPSKGKSGSASRKANANERTSSKNTKTADKMERKPQSQHDVYEDSSDGEGNAAFYSHIDEEARPDMEGMDEASRRRFKATLIGENDDEDDDFEDEEIDEDEAFDEEDEKKYGELLSGIGQSKGSDKGKGKDKPKAKQAREITLSESEDSGMDSDKDEDDEADDFEGDENEGDFKRLDELFDELDEKEDEDEARPCLRSPATHKGQESSAYEKMMATVQGKKKARKMADPSTEQFYPEGEFNLQPSANKGMLTLDAMLGSLKNEVAYADVKRQLAELHKTKELLSQPLAQPVKQKITREEAYEKKKTDITEKWETTILENRKADHLRFPFAEPGQQKLTTAVLAQIDKARASRFSSKSRHPRTDLEKGIADILAQSGVNKKEVEALDGLDPKTLNPEEVKQREEQIKKMKAVLFYEEAKAKRRKKIKSKAYHRILKKKKQKSAMTLEELEQVDQEAAHEEAEKMERLRILERITQRHKNKGKWAQRQLMRSHLDTETRQAISEQIKIRDQLLKKQMNVDDEEDGDIDDMNEEELQEALEKLEQEDGPQVTKGLMGMNFMKRGQKRRAEELQEAKEEWERDMDEMTRQRNANSDDEEGGEKEGEKEQEADVKGRRTINNNRSAQTEGASGPSAPVKFSGATHQTEKAALSSGRTVKMTGHATIEMPDSLKRGAQRKEPQIEQIFAVEEFPEVEGSGPVHDVNQKKAEVAAILKEERKRQHEEAERNSKNKKKKNNAKATPEKKKRKTEPAVQAQSLAQPQTQSTTSQAAAVIDDEEEKEAEAPSKSAGPLSVANAKAPAPRTLKKKAITDESADGHDGAELAEVVVKQGTAKTPRSAPRNPEVTDKENPWMKKSSAATGVVAKKTAHSVITASHAVAAADDKVSKTQKKKALSKRQQAETTLKIDVEKLITDVASTQIKEHDDDRSNAENTGRSSSSFNLLASATEEQKELIKRAFANDDVVEEFKAAKQAELDADMPAAPKPTLMPGWGEWVGEGVVKRKPKKQPRIQKPKRPNELPAKPPTRTDSGLDHVIINQKRDKKLARYQADELPVTYRKQPELYEAQLQTPLGREWNTQNVYDSITRPRIELRKGQIIRPISTPLPKPKTTEQEDKGEPVNRAGGSGANKRKRQPTKSTKRGK